MNESFTLKYYKRKVYFIFLVDKNVEINSQSRQ